MSGSKKKHGESKSNQTVLDYTVGFAEKDVVTLIPGSCSRGVQSLDEPLDLLTIVAVLTT